MAFIPELSSEILNDPLGRGYAGMTNAEVAADLNTAYRNQNRTSISGEEIASAIVASEYNALADAGKDRIIAFTNRTSVNPFGFAQTVFVKLFGAQSQTISALQALRVTQISRAQELGFPAVKEGHVIEARS